MGISGKYLLIIFALVIVLVLPFLRGVLCTYSVVECYVKPLNDVQPSYEVAPELEAKLVQVVTSDPRVQELIQKHDKYQIEGFRIWMKEKKGTNVILGYGTHLEGTQHNLYIDPSGEKVIAILPEEMVLQRPNQNLTGEEMERAIAIALDDPRLQALLEGKDYEIAHEGDFGEVYFSVRRSGARILGVFLDLWFDQTYVINYYPPDHPFYKISQYFNIKSQVIMVDVSFEEQRVYDLRPLTFLGK